MLTAGEQHWQGDRRARPWDAAVSQADGDRDPADDVQVSTIWTATLYKRNWTENL